MAICNRDNDPSQQKENVTGVIPAAVTAATYPIWMAPFPCEVVAAQSAASGLSGTPLHNLGIIRFVAGAGLTTIVGLNSSMALVALGTSGVQGYSLIATGSTLLQMQAKDILCLVTSGAASAALNVTVSVVVKKLQDIVSHYGVAT